MKDMTNGDGSSRLFVLTEEVFESLAYRTLSVHGYRVISRVMVEMRRQKKTTGCNLNGKLAVTRQNFITYGIRKDSVKAGIEECIEHGLLRVTRPGTQNRGKERVPTLYRLTFYSTEKKKPTNEWSAWAKPERRTRRTSPKRPSSRGAETRERAV